ncbi:MAG TPA: hypothetical protein VIU02_01635 [Burkholderiales bacterium]
MIFDLLTFTLIHVILSIVGIIAGLVMVGGFISGTRLNGWTGIYFVTTILTNVTGFGFPFANILPSHIVGGLSLVVLAVALVARYWKHLNGSWRTVFVATAVTALYFNVFVLFAQLFAKVPAMIAIAPTQTAPAFVITHLFILVLFVILGRASVKGFRSERR